jgi:hypothetical protein
LRLIDSGWDHVVPSPPSFRFYWRFRSRVQSRQDVGIRPAVSSARKAGRRPRAVAALPPPPPPHCCRATAAAAATVAFVFILIVVAVIIAIAVAVAVAAFSWLLIVVCAPAITVAVGVFVATVAARGGSTAAFILIIIVVAVIFAVSIAIAVAAFSWLLIVVCAPAIAVAAGVLVTAAALPPLPPPPPCRPAARFRWAIAAVATAAAVLAPPPLHCQHRRHAARCRRAAATLPSLLCQCHHCTAAANTALQTPSLGCLPTPQPLRCYHRHRPAATAAAVLHYYGTLVLISSIYLLRTPFGLGSWPFHQVCGTFSDTRTIPMISNTLESIYTWLMSRKFWLEWHQIVCLHAFMRRD